MTTRRFNIRPKKKTNSTAALVACLGVLFLIPFVLALVAGVITVEAVLGFHLYRAYHPAAWPYIGQKEWFGLAVLWWLFVAPVLRRLRGA